VSKYNKSRGGTITLHTPPAPPDEIRALAVQGQDVVFLGWQKTLSGDIYPLYNILKIGHPLYLSTVTEKTLQAQHLRIPRTPSPYPGVAPSPWHNMGNELVNPATAREAIEAVGLDFTVVRKPMKEFVEPDHAADVSDRWVTVRTDTRDVLGIVGDGYEPIQNTDAFTFFDNLVGSDDAIYETAGTLGRGERIWILAKLPGFINVQGKDIVNKYLLLSNCHDGSSPVRAKLTPIRVVCNNTLTGALKGAEEINIRHTANAAEDMKQALSLLELTNSLYEQLDAVFNRMALTKMSENQLLDYVKALVPDKEEGQDNTENQGIRDAFLELHESGLGADLSRGTLWGAFNCVSEYADHGTESSQGTRLESIWFGQGEQLKQRAFQLAERMM
jgi:phage/plasmid-like protein (TIGR03299 family)